MKISIVYFLLLFFVYNAQCQQKIIGQVIESGTEKGIPYASIIIQNKNYGIMSDSLGHFILEKDKLNDNSNIIISSLGYYQKVIPLSKLRIQKNIIQLDKKIYIIPEIYVRSNMPIFLGVSSKKSKQGFYMGIGTQIALYMNTSKKNQKIDAVGFYIKNKENSQQNLESEFMTKIR